MAVHYRVHGPAQYGITDAGHEVHEGRRQTERQSAHAGSRLKLIDELGRSRLISQPSSRIGENPPYGMRGGDDGNGGIIRSPQRAIVLPDREPAVTAATKRTQQLRGVC